MDSKFVDQFRQLRRAAGISQSMIASRLRTSRQRISRWEKGRVQLSKNELERISLIVGQICSDARNGLVATRVCSACKFRRTFEEFNRDSSKASGRQSICKSCSVTTSRKWRQNQTFPTARHSVSRNTTYLKRDYKAFQALGDTSGMHWVERQYVPPRSATESPQR